MGRDPLLVDDVFLRNSHHPAAHVWRYMKRKWGEDQTPSTIAELAAKVERGLYGYQILRRSGYVQAVGSIKVEGKRAPVNLYQPLDFPVRRPHVMKIIQRMPGIKWRLEELIRIARRGQLADDCEQAAQQLLKVEWRLKALADFMGLELRDDED